MLRASEISLISLKNGGKQIDKINLLPNGSDKTANFITLGSGAQINREALVESVQNLDNTQIIGCFDLFMGPKSFLEKYPDHPSIGYKSIEQLLKTLDTSTSVVFYYPTIPHKQRDLNSLLLLKHFKNSLILCEKPSHCTASEAKEFQNQLKLQGIDPKRFLIGMHSPLHSSRKNFLKLVQDNKNQIKHIDIVFNYPKNPHARGDARVYKKPIGGVMLDLGVYVFQLARELGKVIGFDLLSFDR